MVFFPLKPYATNPFLLFSPWRVLSFAICSFYLLIVYPLLSLSLFPFLFFFFFFNPIAFLPLTRCLWLKASFLKSQPIALFQNKSNFLYGAPSDQTEKNNIFFFPFKRSPQEICFIPVSDTAELNYIEIKWKEN